jgi:hypothetical protein
VKINQLSVFLENRPGHLTAPCAALADAGINILTLTLADTERFGILRLIVRDFEKAKAILEASGCVVTVTEVLAIEVADQPGGLRGLLSTLETAGVNIEYIYAFTARNAGKAVMIFRFADTDKAMKVLAAAGIPVLKSVDLYERSARP